MYAASDRIILAGSMSLESPAGAELLFTENETNNARLYAVTDANGYAKDGINDFVIHRAPSVNPSRGGAKASAHARRAPGDGESPAIYLRLTNKIDSAAAKPMNSTRA